MWHDAWCLPDSFWILNCRSMHHINITFYRVLMKLITHAFAWNLHIITSYPLWPLFLMQTIKPFSDTASSDCYCHINSLPVSPQGLRWGSQRVALSSAEFKKSHANCDRQGHRDTEPRTLWVDRPPAAKCSRVPARRQSAVSAESQTCCSGKAQYVHFCPLLISSFLLHIDLLFHIASQF